jgi:hypothetical protein
MKNNYLLLANKTSSAPPYCSKERRDQAIRGLSPNLIHKNTTKPKSPNPNEIFVRGDFTINTSQKKPHPRSKKIEEDEDKEAAKKMEEEKEAEEAVKKRKDVEELLRKATSSVPIVENGDKFYYSTIFFLNDK